MAADFGTSGYGRVEKNKSAYLLVGSNSRILKQLPNSCTTKTKKNQCCHRVSATHRKRGELDCIRRDGGPMSALRRMPYVCRHMTTRVRPRSTSQLSGCAPMAFSSSTSPPIDEGPPPPTSYVHLSGFSRYADRRDAVAAVESYARSRMTTDAKSGGPSDVSSPALSPPVSSSSSTPGLAFDSLCSLVDERLFPLSEWIMEMPQSLAPSRPAKHHHGSYQIRLQQLDEKEATRRINRSNVTIQTSGAFATGRLEDGTPTATFQLDDRTVGPGPLFVCVIRW